jgi:DNA transformation protein
LYLKADEHTRPRFEAEGGEPFVYLKRGRPMRLGFWRAPDEAMDAPHRMLPWARLALEGALRARAAKRRRAPGKKPGRARRPG